MLNRATRTLESGQTWNAFIPVRTGQIEAGPDNAAGPAAGHYPATTPDSSNGHYRGASPASPLVEGPIVRSTPAGAIPLPRQRADGPLRRRQPGEQLPPGTGVALPPRPPSTVDAQAAREALDEFEAGVHRAQWDVIEADMSVSPAAGHQPLSRRVPGATLPLPGPGSPAPPVTPALALDPDAARALVEQFEYGVALALKETQTQHEGQP
jgi:hypothetical protein